MSDVNLPTVLKKTAVKTLLEVAADLSREMSLDPAIDVTLPKPKLLEAIITDSKLVEISDKFKDTTWDFLRTIKNPAALQRKADPELAEKKTRVKEETAAKKAAPKNAQEKKMTRTAATGLALKEKPKTKQNWIQRADEIYVEGGGSLNIKEAAWSIGTVLKAFTEYGVLSIDADDKIIYHM